MMRRVLVTGSSRGIGRAIAERIATAEFAVTVHCRSRRDEAESTCDAIRQAGGDANILQFDISDRAAARTAIDDDIAAHGAFWGVICNAGLSRDAAFPALSDEDWDQVIDTNLTGFYNVVQPVIMPMIRLRDGGRVITLSSVSGIIGNRGQVNYSAAKAGIIGATKALAIELAKRNITVNCVAPGLIDTEMIGDAPLDEIKKLIPMRRVGAATEVAGLIAFLMSSDASYITRQVISVNGGMT
jgi:3-oxoacyl-[acyl-carrier protein] reductase